MAKSSAKSSAKTVAKTAAKTAAKTSAKASKAEGKRAARAGAPRSAESGGQVQSLLRAIRILKALAQAGPGLTLTDTAHTVGLAPSTAHRLLTTLQYERLVRFDPATALWSIGVEAFNIGSAFLHIRDLAAVARPVMRRLMEESGETVNLAVEDQGEAIYLAQVECREMMRALAKSGARVPLHGSAVGKALLAAMPDSQVAKILQKRGLPKLTEQTIDTPAKLRVALQQVRDQGFAIDDEEHAIGLRCVAAVIYDEHAEPAAAVSLSGPMARIPDTRIGVLGAQVAKAAADISHELGGMPAAMLDHRAAARGTA
jgi:IclR family acetate operon transcriptional repressor